MNKVVYPDWVLKFKTKGTAIVKKQEAFYLYKVSSKWNKDKGRAQKVTEKYLGKVTVDGLIPPKVRVSTVATQLTPITVKEWGATKLLGSIGADITKQLQDLFPCDYQQILVCAYFRLMYASPFKNMPFLFNSSYISEIYKVKLSSASIAEFLKKIGTQRSEIVKFMKFYQNDKYVLFDATHILTQSSQICINHQGYNSKGSFDPQVNLLYSFNATDRLPAYYRIIPGNIREIQAFKLSVQELGMHNTLVIADKGFASNNNIEFLEQEGLNYLIPLRRSSAYIRYQDFANASYFLYKKRPIWFYSYKLDKRTIIVYLDEALKTDETKTYLNLLESEYEGYALEKFKQKRIQFGTFALITNACVTEQEAYEHYKSRLEIETMFDTLKNTLEADKSYMQGGTQLETWFFINHIALLLYYRIFNLLKNTNLLSKHSPSDVLMQLSQIKTVNINNMWHISEINAETKKLVKELGIEDHITENLKS